MLPKVRHNPAEEQADKAQVAADRQAATVPIPVEETPAATVRVAQHVNRVLAEDSLSYSAQARIWEKWVLVRTENNLFYAPFPVQITGK